METQTNEMAVLGVTGAEEAIYRHFLRNPETTVDDIHLLLDMDQSAVRERLSSLEHHGLVRIGEGGRVLPSDPDAAVGKLTDRRLGELHDELQQVTGARRLADSLRAERSSRGRGAHGVEQLTDLSEIRSRIDDLSFFARHEVLSVEPYTELRPENIEHARPLDLRCLRRGLRVRSIVLHKALEHPPTAAYLRELESHGARIRVVDETSERILVYDRKTAVVPMDPADTSRGALLASEDGLVANIVALFERIWEQAEDLPSELDGAAGKPPLSEVERQVFQAMCSGDKDEVGARDIGVSVRTYRRHIADLMQLLGANNRAQAALLAREQGWI